MTPTPSPKPPVAPLEAPALSTEDLKQQVKRIRDSALEDVKRTRDDIVESEQGRLVGIVAGVLVVGLSLAYFAGARRSKRAADAAYRRMRAAEQADAMRLAVALKELAGE